MADTPRTKAAVLALFPDNTTGAISAQDLRDFVVSVTDPVASGGFESTPTTPGIVFLAEAVGNATTDTATWQDALDEANGTAGVHIIAPAGDYWINASLKVYDNTKIQGAGWDAGTKLSWHGSTLGARRSLLEAANFSLTTTASNSGFRISDIYIAGRGNSTGNGMTGWWDKAHIEHVWIDGWDGTTTGHGLGILLATDNAATGTTLSGGENCFISHCRFDCQRGGIRNEAGGDQYTDGQIEGCEFLKQIGGNSDGDGIADVWLEQSGGWVLRDLHTNGSLGHGIYLASCAFTKVEGCFLDGWGCGANTNSTYAAVYVDGFSSFRGGTGGIIIDSNNFKARGWQNTTDAPGCKWVAFWIKPATIAFDGTVIIANNTGWRRPASGDDRDGTHDATAGSGTTEANQVGNFFVKLDQTTSSPAQVTYVLVGNNPQWTQDGTPLDADSLPYSDVNIFAVASSLTSPRSRVDCEGNIFQYGTAAPTAGFWFKNVKRYNDVTASTTMGWGNSATGVSGTWKTMPSYGA